MRVGPGDSGRGTTSRRSPTGARCVAGALALATLLAAAAGQQYAPDAPGYRMHPTGAFKFVAPASWRQLTISEARDLARNRPAGFPADVIQYEGMPPANMPFGDVDRWLATGFDGECLLVFVESGEVGLDDESLAQIRTRAHEVARETGARREIVDLRLTRIGGDRHEAVACSARVRLTPDTPWYRTYELYLPSGGNTVMLIFRCQADEFAAREPRFREIADSVVLARAPVGRSGLNDRLLQAALVGALVGMLLMILHKRRQGPKPAAGAGAAPPAG